MECHILYLSKSKSNSKSLVLNTSMKGRYFGDDIRENIGMFVKKIPLKLEYDGDMSFRICGIEDLLAEIANDSSKNLKAYHIQGNELFKAENFFKSMIHSFDNPTTISPE